MDRCPHLPNELFLRLRSAEIPAREKIVLARIALSDASWILPHKKTYLLKWLLEHHSQKPIHPQKACLIDQAEFWVLLQELLSQMDSREIMEGVPGSIIQSFVQNSGKLWSFSASNACTATAASASFATLFGIISHRLTFEVIMNLLRSTLEGVNSLEGPTPVQVNNMTLLISDDAIRIIRQTSSHRKAALLLQEELFLTPLLHSISNFGQFSSVGQSLTHLIADCIFSVDYMKRLLSNTTMHGAGRNFEWICVLRCAIVKDIHLARSAIELLPCLLLDLINEQLFLQTHIFKKPLTTSTSLESKTTSSPVKIQSSQDLVIYFMSSSHLLLLDLMKHFRLDTIELSMTSIKNMITHIFVANIYSLTNRYHYDVLDQVANDCIEHLKHPSDIAAKSFEILSSIWSIDCRIIEEHLAQILRFAVIATCDQVKLALEVNAFLGSLIDWFSKAKRLPQFLSLLLDAVDWNLSESTLQTLLSGPLTSRAITRRFRRELQLSASPMQIRSALDTAAQRLITSFRSAVSCRTADNEDERIPKKPKKTHEAPPSLASMADEPASATDSEASKTEVARCLYNCHFYIIVATAASRSSLRGGDQDQLYAALDNTFQEIESSLSFMCPESQSVKQTKRKRTTKISFGSHVTQSIAASAFSVLNTISEARPLHPDSRRINLRKWLKVLRRAVSGKLELNPALTIQIIRASLLEISASVTAPTGSGDNIPPIYDIILEILGGALDSDADHDWNGVFNPLTATQLPCATWYMFSTAHLSNFSDHATPQQLEKLALIILRCSPFRHTPGITQDKNDERVNGCITFRKVNSTLLSSPSFHEFAPICKSLLENGLRSLDQMIALRHNSPDITQPCEIRGGQQRIDSTSLLANLARLPLDCFSRGTKTVLLQKCLDWSLQTSALYIASTTSSPTDVPIQSNLTIAIIYSTRCCLTLISAIESTLDQSLLGKLLSVMCFFLSDRIDWQLCSYSDVLYELTELFIKQGISFVFRCTSGLSLSLHQEQTRLTALLLTGMVRVSQQKSSKDLGTRHDELIVSTFDSVVESLQYCVEKCSVPNHSVHKDWIGYIGRLIKQTAEAVKTLTTGHLPLNCSQLALCKIYFILSRVVDSTGVKGPANNFSFGKVIAACSHAKNKPNWSIEASVCSDRVTSGRRLALKAIEEMINTRRNKSAKSYEGDDTRLAQCFQLLTILYVSSLVGTRADAAQQKQELKAQYQAACKLVSAMEYQATLAMLLQEYDQLLSRLNNPSLDHRERLHSVETLRALTETASIMMLSGPEGLGKCCHGYISAFICRFQHPAFSSLRTSGTLLWQCQFLECICTAKINLIGRQDIALILEIVLQTLSWDSLNESLPPELDFESIRRMCRKLYHSLIMIVSQISRHRREHVIPVFHVLMAILIAFLYPLCRPVYLFNGRKQTGSKTVPSKMVRQAQGQFPAWSWHVSTAEAEWDKFGCGTSEVEAYCRLLVSLGVKTTHVGRRAVKTDATCEPSKVSGVDAGKLRPAIVSLMPPLSKHGPFYLIQYVKLCTGLSGIRLPNQFHESLLPGISVLMNATGKHERESIGKMLSQSYHSSWPQDPNAQLVRLEEEGDQEAQKEWWRKLLSVWELRRYKGVD